MSGAVSGVGTIRRNGRSFALGLGSAAVLVATSSACAGHGTPPVRVFEATVRQDSGGLQSGVYDFAASFDGVSVENDRAIPISRMVTGTLSILSSVELMVSIPDAFVGNKASVTAPGTCRVNVGDKVHDADSQFRVACGNIRLFLHQIRGEIIDASISARLPQLKGTMRGQCRSYATDPVTGARGACLAYDTKPFVRSEWSGNKPLQLVRSRY